MKWFHQSCSQVKGVVFLIHHRDRTSAKTCVHAKQPSSLNKNGTQQAIKSYWPPPKVNADSYLRTRTKVGHRYCADLVGEGEGIAHQPILTTTPRYTMWKTVQQSSSVSAERTMTDGSFIKRSLRGMNLIKVVSSRKLSGKGCCLV